MSETTGALARVITAAHRRRTVLDRLEAWEQAAAFARSDEGQRLHVRATRDLIAAGDRLAGALADSIGADIDTPEGVVVSPADGHVA